MPLLGRRWGWAEAALEGRERAGHVVPGLLESCSVGPRSQTKIPLAGPADTVLPTPVHLSACEAPQCTRATPPSIFDVNTIFE